MLWRSTSPARHPHGFIEPCLPALGRGIVTCAFLTCALLSNAIPVHAQWWNLFAPRDFEECAESAAKDAKSKAALDILLGACDAKFRGRRKLGGGYTYYDSRQNRSFDIAGPNPTQRELETINKQYSIYLEEKRQAEAAAAEAAFQQKLLQAEIEKKRQQEQAELEMRRQQAQIEMDHRRKVAAQYIQVGPAKIDCEPYVSLPDSCSRYKLTIELKNRSRETIQTVHLGWVFVSQQQPNCPTSFSTKYYEMITISPGGTAVLNVDTRFDGPDYRGFRYCVGLTGVDIVP
jgi:Skp family chaperone for outer membrane proteins